jgi:hypothetical protein
MSAVREMPHCPRTVILRRSVSPNAPRNLSASHRTELRHRAALLCLCATLDCGPGPGGQVLWPLPTVLVPSRDDAKHEGHTPVVDDADRAGQRRVKGGSAKSVLRRSSLRRTDCRPALKRTRRARPRRFAVPRRNRGEHRGAGRQDPVAARPRGREHHEYSLAPALELLSHCGSQPATALID